MDQIHDSWGVLESRVNQGLVWKLKTSFAISTDGKSPLKPKFIGLAATTLACTGQRSGHMNFYKLV